MNEQDTIKQIFNSIRDKYRSSEDYLPRSQRPYTDINNLRELLISQPIAYTVYCAVFEIRYQAFKIMHSIVAQASHQTQRLAIDAALAISTGHGECGELAALTAIKLMEKNIFPITIYAIPNPGFHITKQDSKEHPYLHVYTVCGSEQRWVSDPFLNLCCQRDEFQKHDTLITYLKSHNITNPKGLKHEIIRFYQAKESLQYLPGILENINYLVEQSQVEIDQLKRDLSFSQVESDEEINALRNNILKYASRRSGVSLEGQNLFISSSASSDDPHIAVLSKARNFCEDKPNYSSFLNAIEDKNYALALRKVCADGVWFLVKLLLQYKDQLGFDINEPSSSNQKTALDWAMELTIDSRIKNNIIKLLKDHGAMNSEVNAMQQLSLEPK